MPRPEYIVKIINNKNKVILEATKDWLKDATDFIADLTYDQSIALKDIKKIVISFGRKKK